MTERAGKTGDPPKRADGSRSGLSVHADAKAIFDHALACVLPEPAIRRYVQLDETTNTLTVAGRRYDLHRA